MGPLAAATIRSTVRPASTDPSHERYELADPPRLIGLVLGLVAGDHARACMAARAWPTLAGDGKGDSELVNGGPATLIGAEGVGMGSEDSERLAGDPPLREDRPAQPLHIHLGHGKTRTDPGRLRTFWRWLWLQFVTRPGRVALAILVGGVVVVAGELIEHLWVKGAGSAVVACGVVVAVMGIFMWPLSFVRRLLPDATSAAQAMIYLLTFLFEVFFQALVAAIAASGDRTVIAAFVTGHAGSGSWGIVAFSFTWAIPWFVVVTPEFLRRNRPWREATDLAKTLVPAWLAAAAALATWASVVAEHFFGGLLWRTSVWLALVGGLTAAALLAPLYQFMARSGWEYGVGVVLDPAAWRKAWRTVGVDFKLAWEHAERADELKRERERERELEERKRRMEQMKRARTKKELKLARKGKLAPEHADSVGNAEPGATGKAAGSTSQDPSSSCPEG